MPGCRCCCCSGSINNYWQLSAGATATGTSTGRITLPTLRRDATRRYRAAISAFLTFHKTKDLSNELWQLIKCERTVNCTSTQRTDHPTGHYALTHALSCLSLLRTPSPPISSFTPRQYSQRPWQRRCKRQTEKPLKVFERQQQPQMKPRSESNSRCCPTLRYPSTSYRVAGAAGKTPIDVDLSIAYSILNVCCV